MSDGSTSNTAAPQYSPQPYMVTQNMYQPGPALMGPQHQGPPPQNQQFYQYTPQYNNDPTFNYYPQPPPLQQNMPMSVPGMMHPMMQNMQNGFMMPYPNSIPPQLLQQQQHQQQYHHHQQQQQQQYQQQQQQKQHQQQSQYSSPSPASSQTRKKYNPNAPSFVPQNTNTSIPKIAPTSVQKPPVAIAAVPKEASTPSVVSSQTETSVVETQKEQETRTTKPEANITNTPSNTTQSISEKPTHTSPPSTVPTTETYSASDSSTSPSTPSSASTSVSPEAPLKTKTETSTTETLVNKPTDKDDSLKALDDTKQEEKELESLETSSANDDFTLLSNGSIDLPLLFGSSDEKFLVKRKEYGILREAKRLELQKEAEEKITKKNTEDTTPALRAAIPLRATEVTSPITNTSTTPQADDKEEKSEPEPELKLASPISSPEPVKPVMAAWSAIALQGAKKQVPKSTSASPVTPISSKREERFVPSVSNVLEPLGVVILRYMFDKNFLKLANQSKLPKIVPRGLVNTGNICFMSSIVQMLLYCQPFYKALHIISTKTIQSLSREQSQTPLLDALVELYTHFNIKLENKKQQESEFGDSVTPTDFYKAISKSERFQHLQWGQQEDAEEFFGYLLDGLNEEFTACVKRLNDHEIKTLMNSSTDDVRNVIKANLRKFQEGEFNSSETSGRSDSINEDGWQEVGTSNKKTAKRTVEVKPSPIRLLFGGQFRSVLTVPNSKDSLSITLDPFQQIQLDISDESTKTLEDAFAQLSEIEEIPYKSTDGSDVLAKKQTFIDKFPEVLVVHLKRFSFVSNRRIEKLRKKIAYSHELKIPNVCISPSTKKFLTSDVKYKLTGVVYHHGMSSDGGHYTVDVLRGDEGKWIRIDDVSITSLTSDEVLNGENDEVKTAYILMYQKV